MTKYEAFKDQAKWRQKQLITILIILLVFFWLKEWFVELFNDYAVKYVLSKFSKEAFGFPLILVYGVLLILGVSTLYQKCVKDRYQASLVSVFMLVLACVFYWQERLSGLHYHFYSLLDWPEAHPIAQTDPLFVILPLLATVLLSNYSVSRKFKSQQGFLNQDLPIANIGADQLNRTGYYQQLIGHLHALAFDTTRSFSIGVNSAWGYGKTSLLNIIRQGLKEKDDQIVCIDYNPWLSAGKNSLTFDFFAVLEHHLSNYINNTNILLDYARRVSKVDNDDNKLKGWVDAFESDETLRERFDEIGELIRYTGKRFFIIIDDLDRLDNDEVFEVLRLIRNVANFPRLTYIAAYDKFYVINALRSKRIRLPEQYLEKIFELEIELPKIDDRKIRDILHETIKAGFEHITLDQNAKTNLSVQLLFMIYNPTSAATGKPSVMARNLENIFKTKRDILRFANSFLLSLSLNKDLLFLPDLFILEALKLNSSDLYHQLAASNKYLDINNSGLVPIYQLYQANGRAADIVAANASRTGLFEFIKPTQPTHQQELVRALFSAPETAEWKSDKSIVMAHNFKTYFIFAQPQGAIAAEEVDQLLNP